MSNTTYQVILSSDGKHTVIVNGDNQGEMRLANAWAQATYDAIVERYGAKYPAKQNAPEIKTSEAEPAPLCGVHNVPMQLMHGKKGDFFSCHERNADNSFCNFRPKNPQA